MIEVTDFPSHWRVVPAWSLYERVKRTGNPDKELLSVYRDYGVIPKSSRDDNHNVESEDLSSYQLVQAGDLVVNKMKAWQGSFAVSDFEGIVSPAYFVYKSKHSENSRFLHYLLRSAPYMAHYNRISSGVRIGQWDLDPSQFRVTGVGLPPRSEQDAIVGFLDRELEQIDSLVEKQKKLVELSKERLRSAILGVTNPPASGNSGKWREAKVSELGTLTNGYPFDSNTFSHEGELPLVRIRDLKASEFETYIPKGTCPQSHVVQDGDLLIGMDGDFNAVLWSRGFAALNQRVARLRFKSPEVATYVAFAIQDKLNRINELTYSTTVKHLSSGQIINIKIAMPPSEELSDKAKKLTQLTKSMGEMLSVSEKLVATLIERRQALISGAVSGKLELEGAS